MPRDVDPTGQQIPLDFGLSASGTDLERPRTVASNVIPVIFPKRVGAQTEEERSRQEIIDAALEKARKLPW